MAKRKRKNRLVGFTSQEIFLETPDGEWETYQFDALPEWITVRFRYHHLLLVSFSGGKEVKIPVGFNGLLLFDGTFIVHEKLDRKIPAELRTELKSARSVHKKVIGVSSSFPKLERALNTRPYREDPDAYFREPEDYTP